MLVFWKERFVLLSVPKTGTQAYAKALAPYASIVITDPPELKHAPVYRYNRFFRPMFEKLGADHLDIVAVIREPVSWLGSWYRYRRRDALIGRPTSTREIDFDTFLRASCDADPPPYANVGSQAKFVEQRPNGTKVTHMFRYEDQARFRSFLKERIGTLPDIPQVNVSPNATLSATPETLDLLQEMRAADFALWNGLQDSPPR